MVSWWARVAMLFVSAIYLYGAISKINKLAGGGVFKLYRIFIAIDGAMILLSFSAKCAPVSTRKVLFFVICDTAVLSFLLWIKIKTRCQAKRPIFRLWGLCTVGTLIASTLNFRPLKASRNPYLTEIIILDICLVLKLAQDKLKTFKGVFLKESAS